METLLQLFAFLRDLWSDITFWFVVPQSQNAVVLRNGIYSRTCGPGLHYKYPCIFSIGEEVSFVDAVTETTETQAQSLTTLDGVEVVVSAIIKHKVSDPKIYITEVMDVKDAIVDITMGKIRKNIMARNWEDCKNESMDNDIAKQSRAEAKKWGVQIEDVTIINLVKIRSIRIIGLNM